VEVELSLAVELPTGDPVRRLHQRIHLPGPEPNLQEMDGLFHLQARQVLPLLEKVLHSPGQCAMSWDVSGSREEFSILPTRSKPPFHKPIPAHLQGQASTLRIQQSVVRRFEKDEPLGLLRPPVDLPRVLPGNALVLPAVKNQDPGTGDRDSRVTGEPREKPAG